MTIAECREVVIVSHRVSGGVMFWVSVAEFRGRTWLNARWQVRTFAFNNSTFLILHPTRFWVRLARKPYFFPSRDGMLVDKDRQWSLQNLLCIQFQPLISHNHIFNGQILTAMSYLCIDNNVPIFQYKYMCINCSNFERRWTWRSEPKIGFHCSNESSGLVT